MDSSPIRLMVRKVPTGCFVLGCLCCCLYFLYFSLFLPSFLPTTIHQWLPHSFQAKLNKLNHLHTNFLQLNHISASSNPTTQQQQLSLCLSPLNTEYSYVLLIVIVGALVVIYTAISVVVSSNGVPNSCCCCCCCYCNKQRNDETSHLKKSQIFSSLQGLSLEQSFLFSSCSANF